MDLKTYREWVDLRQKYIRAIYKIVSIAWLVWITFLLIKGRDDNSLYCQYEIRQVAADVESLKQSTESNNKSLDSIGRELEELNAQFRNMRLALTLGR